MGTASRRLGSQQRPFRIEIRYREHKGEKQDIGKDSLSLEAGYESDKPNRQVMANRSHKNLMGGMKETEGRRESTKDYGLEG